MSRMWKILVVINTLCIITILSLFVARECYWLSYEREQCMDSLANEQTGMCQLEMDAPLEFHYYYKIGE